MGDVKLMHVIFRGDTIFHFYDGQRDVKKGIITIPSDKPEWVRRAYASGYRFSPDGKSLEDWTAIEVEIAKQNAKSVGSTESEDTDTGGQSEASDGLRENQPDSSGSVAEGGTRDSGSGSTADRETTPAERPITLSANSASPIRRSLGNANDRESV